MAESFVDLLEATARRRPERPALVGDGGAVTDRDLDRRAAEVAASLARGGLRPGQRIAISIPNHPDFVIAVLAALKLGATVAPLDPLLKPEERTAILTNLAPALTLEQAALVRLAAGEGTGGTGSGPPSVRLGFGAKEGGPDPVPPVPSPGTPDASAPPLILYTSGSTGRPKGAVLSHRALCFANESWVGPVMALGPDDVVLGVLPFSHSYGLNGALLAPLLAGARIVVIERFSPDAVLDAIAAHRVTVFPGVATMFRRVLDAPRLARADLSSLRLAVSGAAPCPWDLAHEWRSRTGVRIVRGYGMTELFRPISYLADDPADVPESIGRPVPGVEVRILSPEGRLLATGEVGELWIRTPAALDGYLDAPEETRAVLHDGWFKTGDLAAVSADGFVRIAGRERERILRGGYSVFPQEIEAVLLTHPAVAEAAVVGVRHAELGEEVAAFVALREGRRAAAAELVAYCKERLAAFKYPRQVTIVDTLPKSATGKILKSRLAG